MTNSKGAHMYGLRLKPGEYVNTLYRARRGKDGEVEVLYRIVWNGDKTYWSIGDGFFAHERTGWRWCPEDFTKGRGIAWRVTGMGGADDDTEPISRDEALAAHGVKLDSVDLGKYPSKDEEEDWQRVRRNL
jgi:hypothetical protein